MGHGDIKKNGRFRLGHAAPGEIHLKHAAGQKEYKEGIIYWTKYQKMVSRVIREAEQVHGIIARGDKPQCPSWLQDRLYLVDPPHGPKFKLNNSGKWHASYDAAIESGWLDKMSEVYSGYRPKWGGKIEFYKNFEQAIYYVSDCMTFWDSDAIIASAANEIISEKQIDDFILSRLHFYQSPEFIERISGKGNPALQLVALSAHFHDGVVHLHPAYLISMPLLFKRSWGEYVTKSFAPKGGRRSKGSGWSGGERLGKIGQTGKLIIEAAGPALAGAVAVRTAGLSSDYKLNPTWNKLHFVLEDRAYIKSDKIDELISKASDRCYDLFCAKEMIEELNRDRKSVV